MCQLVLIEKCGASLVYSMMVVEEPVPNKLLIYSTLGHVWSVSPENGAYSIYNARA